MATNAQNTPAEEKKANTTPAASTYTVEEICAAARPAFKNKAEVITGALSHVYGDEYASRKYTKAEVNAAIEKYRKKEVK